MRVRISKEHRELAAWAARFGWTWKLTSGTHIRWEHPKVPQPVFSPGTPSTCGSAKPRQKMRMAYRLATGREMEADGG